MNLMKNEITHDCHPCEGRQEEIHITVSKHNANPIGVVDVLKILLIDDQIEE